MRQLFIKIVVFICRINMPFLQPKMKDEEVESIISKLKPSMVILVRREGELTNLFQPDHFTHAALVISSDHCIEAKTTGTVITNLTYLLSRVDEVIVLEPRFLTNNESMIDMALKFVNRPYDYSFQDGDDKVYCFELVAHILEHCSGVEIPKCDTKLGMKFLPDSFLKANLFTRVV